MKFFAQGVFKVSQSTNEFPRTEMRNILRAIAGVRGDGETEQRRIERALNLMNAGGALGRYTMSYRTAYSYWYARPDDDSDVPSRHMDRARKLSGQPIVSLLIAQHQSALKAINDNLDRLPCHDGLTSTLMAA